MPRSLPSFDQNVNPVVQLFFGMGRCSIGHDVRHSDNTQEGGKWTLHVIVNCFSTSMDSHLTHVWKNAFKKIQRA